MRKRIALIGAGDTGAEVVDLVRLLGSFEIVGFCDDLREAGSLYCGLPVLGDTHQPMSLHDNDVNAVCICVTGNMELRRSLILRYLRWGFELPTICHPAIEVSQYCEVSENACLILGFNTLAPYSSLGLGSVMKSYSSLSYHARVGNYCMIGPYTFVGPRARIEERSELRARVTVRSDIRLGPQTIVGPHTYVTARKVRK